MKLPRTMGEALKQGYVVDSGDSKHNYEKGTATGEYELEKEGHPILTVPYKATFKFGRPRRSLWRKKQRELLRRWA